MNIGLEEQRVSKKQHGHGVTLPESFIPFILEHIDEFEARVEGESIVLALKPDAHGNGKGRLATMVSAAPAALAPQVRPKFVYTVIDRKLTPEQAGRYGFSEQRLKVYSAIYAEKEGIQSKELLTKTELPHGTVQQILHWLRDHKLISGEPTS